MYKIALLTLLWAFPCVSHASLEGGGVMLMAKRNMMVGGAKPWVNPYDNGSLTQMIDVLIGDKTSRLLPIVGDLVMKPSGAYSWAEDGALVIESGSLVGESSYEDLLTDRGITHQFVLDIRVISTLNDYKNLFDIGGVKFTGSFYRGPKNYDWTNWPTYFSSIAGSPWMTSQYDIKRLSTFTLRFSPLKGGDIRQQSIVDDLFWNRSSLAKGTEVSTRTDKPYIGFGDSNVHTYFYAHRVYDRFLSDEEVAYFEAIDKARFGLT